VVFQLRHLDADPLQQITCQSLIMHLHIVCVHHLPHNIGNTTTTLHLILYPGKCVVVRSHICNDRLLIWTGLVHVFCIQEPWNTKLIVGNIKGIVKVLNMV